MALVTEISDAPMPPGEALGLVKLDQRRDHFPAQLSGGEQQRVAIARAIAKRPSVLLCDEPTGALDISTGIVVLEALARVNDELGTTTVVITHNAAIASMADRVIRLADGRVTASRIAPRSWRSASCRGEAGLHDDLATQSQAASRSAGDEGRRRSPSRWWWPLAWRCTSCTCRTSTSLRETRDGYYERQRFADVFATLKRAPLRVANEIAAIPGVSAIEARVVATVTLDMAQLDEPAIGPAGVDPAGPAAPRERSVSAARTVDRARPTGRGASPRRASSWHTDWSLAIGCLR